MFDVDLTARHQQESSGPPFETDAPVIETGSGGGGRQTARRGGGGGGSGGSDQTLSYRNILRYMWGRDYNNARLVSFAVRNKMTAQQFAAYVRLRDPNYTKSLEFRVRARDFASAWHEMMGADSKLKKAVALRFIRGDYSAGAVKDYIKGTAEFKARYPGIQQDMEPGEYRAQLLGAHQMARQLWGRDLSAGEQAMIFSRGLSNEQLQQDAAAAPLYSEAIRWSTGQAPTAGEQQNMIFSGRLAAQLRGRGQKGLAMQESLLKSQVARPLLARRQDNTLLQPLI